MSFGLSLSSHVFFLSPINTFVLMTGAVRIAMLWQYLSMQDFLGCIPFLSGHALLGTLPNTWFQAFPLVTKLPCRETFCFFGPCRSLFSLVLRSSLFYCTCGHLSHTARPNQSYGYGAASSRASCINGASSMYYVIVLVGTGG